MFLSWMTLKSSRAQHLRLVAIGVVLIAGVSAAVAAEVVPAASAPPDCPLGHVSRVVEGPAPKPVVSLKKQRWEREHGGKEAAKAHVVARLSARPQRFLADKQGLPQDDGELAWRLARDTWRGLRGFTDRHNGLPVDHVHVRGSTPAAASDAADAPVEHPGPPELEVGDYTNVTNIGLYLMAIVAAHELKLIARDEALGLVRAILASVHKLERHKGLFFNYYDTTSMERTSSFVSFVDSAWLTAGLMVARQAFPEVRQSCSALVDQADYGRFYDRRTHRIAHGFFVNPSARSPYDYGLLYTEARLGSLIAIGKGDVGREHWFSMLRILPPGCDWQSLPPVSSKVRTVAGARVAFGQYEWKGERFVASWGGSMFEALMPTLVLDEPRLAPKSLGWNDRQHAVIQRRYATEDLGDPVWGASPSARPVAGGYSEYGVPVLGVRGYAAGAVTPHAAALTLAVTPQAALANLRQLATSYDIYGDYGFFDAVEPRSGKVAHTYLTLDQLMLFIALANHLEPHCIQEHFAADAIVKRFLPLLALEDDLWQGDNADGDQGTIDGGGGRLDNPPASSGMVVEPHGQR